MLKIILTLIMPMIVTYIKDNVITTEIQLQTNIEAVVHAPPKLCICNIYLSNSYNFLINEIKDLIE